MVKPKIVQEWFEKGSKDIRDAGFLFNHNRALETISFHIHQGAEKYLKGFLISKGKELEMIHDLVKLLRDAIKIDSAFEQFKEIAEKVTNFYFESRYPVGYEVEYTKQEIEQCLAQIKKLIKLIKEKTK
jgi:HEPN domain-containing protein